MEIELRHLRAFITVAEERHFGRAAQRLHVAQPSLSQQIRRLEKELGVELFDRNSQPIGLTSAGSAFLRDARPALHKAGEAVERARRAGRGELGQLYVGAFSWAFRGILPVVTRAFHERFPDVRLELSIEPPQDGLREGLLDVGLARWPVDARGLEFELLMEEALVAIVPAHDRLAKQPGVTLDALAEEPFVTPGQFVDRETALLDERGLKRTVVQEVEGPHIQLNLIAAGVGVGLYPASASGSRHPGVAFIPIEGEAPTVTLALLWRHGDTRELVHHFLDTAREVAHVTR